MGGSRDSVVQGLPRCCILFQAVVRRRSLTDSDDLLPPVAGFPAVGAGESPDRAIDTALRTYRCRKADGADGDVGGDVAG